MITREEADVLYDNSEPDTNDVWDLIQDIYNSIGSCSKCKHLKPMLYTPNGEPKTLPTCKLHLMVVTKDFFCKEFKVK